MGPACNPRRNYYPPSMTGVVDIASSRRTTSERQPQLVVEKTHPGWRGNYEPAERYLNSRQSLLGLEACLPVSGWPLFFISPSIPAGCADYHAPFSLSFASTSLIPVFPTLFRPVSQVFQFNFFFSFLWIEYLKCYCKKAKISSIYRHSTVSDAGIFFLAFI